MTKTHILGIPLVLTWLSLAAGAAAQPHAAPAAGPYYASRDFGAIPNDGLDDLAALQSAVHAAIRDRKPLILEAGQYHISDTLHIGGDHALCGQPGSILPNCSFVSLTLRGENSGAHMGAGAQIVTMFGVDRLDRPAINIQGVRDARIENLLVAGENDVPRAGTVLTTTHIDPDPTAWACATCSLSRHSPYAGIAIDGYSGAEPLDGYPVGPTVSYFGEANPNHSSAIEFNNVSTDSFAVGMAINPSPNASNAEDIELHRVRLRYAAYALVLGGSQSRNVSLEDSNLSYAHTLITTTKFGVGDAPPPLVRDSNLGAAVRLFDYRHTHGVAVVDGVHAEAYAWIGNFGTESGTAAVPVTINASNFHAYSYDYKPPFVFTSMGPVSFRGTLFRSDDGRAFSYLTLGEAARVTFDACSLSIYGNGIENGYRPIGAQMLAGEERKTTAVNSRMVWGSTSQAMDTIADYWSTPPTYLSPHVRALYDAVNHTTVPVAPGPLTTSYAVTAMVYGVDDVTFDTTNPGAFSVGDFLLSWATNPANTALGGWVPGLQVTDVTGNTVTADMRVSLLSPGTTSTVWKVLPVLP